MGNEATWIAAGYEIAAHQGFDKLNIKNLAQELGRNRSSFYHYFGDMEIFMAELLKCHERRCARIIEQEDGCQNFDPDWMLLMIENKDELLFNRQLRIYCDIPLFNDCFERTTRLNYEKIRRHWAEYIGVESHPDLALEIFQLSIRAYLFQNTEDTMTLNKMQNFFQLVQMIVKQIHRLK